MSDNFSQLLVDLASNPDTMAAFLADPVRVCDEAGLDHHEQEVIRSGDPRLISGVVAPSLWAQQKGHDGPKPPGQKGGKKKSSKKKGGTKKR